jgi:hypothetical protein
MRNVSNKSCTGNQNTHCVFSTFFENAIYDIMRKKIVGKENSSIAALTLKFTSAT